MGVTLPRALSPWARSLALFPEELSLALAPLLARLGVLIGPAGRTSGAAGEPDGYDGVARRGTYERLLGTEWLLLAEAPEEFLRRATAGEHSFLKMAHRPPPGGRSSAVLFDAGPDQLGSPRILHLAALIVLAARIEALGGSLLWGALQQDTDSLQTEIGRRSIRELLEARSRRPAGPGDVERWLGDARVAGASERWLVGAGDLRPPGTERVTSALVVSDVLLPGVRRLHVSVLAAGATAPREVELDLPDERACVRLLRDPFDGMRSRGRPAAERAARVDPDGGMVFSVNGRRLFLRGDDGQLLSFVVVNSANAPVPPPGVFEPPAGQSVIAAGVEPRKGRTVAVCAGEKVCFAHRLSHSRRTAIETVEYRLAEGALPPEPGPLGSVVPAEANPDHGGLRVMFAGCDEHLVLSDGVARWAPPPAAPEHGIERFWNPPLIRVEDEPPERWWDIGLPLGVEGETDEEWTALRRDRMAVERRTRRGLEVLFTTAAPIFLIKSRSSKGHIAFLTEDWTLGVYSMAQGTLVLQASLSGWAE